MFLPRLRSKDWLCFLIAARMSGMLVRMPDSLCPCRLIRPFSHLSRGRNRKTPEVLTLIPWGTTRNTSVWHLLGQWGLWGALRNPKEHFWIFAIRAEVSLINLFHPPSTRYSVTRPQRSNFKIARSSSHDNTWFVALFKGPLGLQFGCPFLLFWCVSGLPSLLLCSFRLALVSFSSFWGLCVFMKIFAEHWP